MPDPLATAAPLSPTELEVVVTRGAAAGFSFFGWESVEITRNLNAAAGAFRLTVSDRLPWPILPSDSIQIKMGSTLVLTGTVDTIDGISSSSDHKITVSGRDKTAILVDASALNDPGEWFNIGLLKLCEELASPLGIKVRSELGILGDYPLERFETFKIQPGESAWNAIERACRLRAVLTFATPGGELALVQSGASGAANTELHEGSQLRRFSRVTQEPGNLISTHLHYTHAERFAVYVVRGQRSGGDDGWGEEVALVEGRALDPELPSERQLLVLAEGQVTFDSAQDRAQWEATQRAARSSTVTCLVAGWRQDPASASTSSPLWFPNLRVAIRVESLQLDTELLVEQVKFSRSITAGTRTSLRLVRVDAFQAKPVVDPKTQPFGDLLGGQDLGTLSADDFDL